MALFDLRKQVYKANLEIVRHGLVVFTWGNASAIDTESRLMVIKPSGIDYDNMNPAAMVIVDLDGNVVEGTLRPSSDTKTHIELYKNFPEIGSIVHTHSVWATCFAQAGTDIPPLGTTHADYTYKAIPCTREMTRSEIRGDYELNTGKIIVETLKNTGVNNLPCVLVRNYGPFVWGDTPEKAVHNAVVLEKIAELAYHTIQLGNSAPISKDLLDKHFLRKNGESKYYGQLQ